VKMETVMVHLQHCCSHFWGERVVPCCQKQQIASDNQPAAATALRWTGVAAAFGQCRVKAAAMAFPLPWHGSYPDVAMVLL